MLILGVSKTDLGRRLLGTGCLGIVRAANLSKYLGDRHSKNENPKQNPRNIYDFPVLGLSSSIENVNPFSLLQLLTVTATQADTCDSQEGYYKDENYYDENREMLYRSRCQGNYNGQKTYTLTIKKRLGQTSISIEIPGGSKVHFSGSNFKGL